MKRRRREYQPPQPEPIDHQTMVTRCLCELIRSALSTAGAETMGYNYTTERERRDQAKERAATLRRLRDEFELAMSGVELDVTP